ncbi:uncharacterized protein BCR38DRAFT_428100 [Pseudomassariella vexata]|uniref:MYND-type domain-containing protein n=1 Tax=Pseudomassariella vexata TaxID=1141098 RepID=A0A1Y2E8L3_9PEZI|nr:uncharacterized protein BCR38DRAFT_428100 [Pseudomassariella vexata]ORY67767.1 hypothetical protein BCR38DRAFT_428100 [Pseudomassariella vexata]
MIRQCAVCWLPGTLCTQCKSASYCSKTCQKADWPSHQLLCKAITRQGTRPTPAHKRALYFPAERRQPEFFWVECPHDDYPDDPGMPDILSIQAYVGAPHYASEKVRLNPRLGRFSPRMVEFFGANPMPKKMGNRSLRAACKAYGSVRRGWEGPLVVLGISAAPCDVTADEILGNGLAGGGIINYDDINLFDLRTIVDWSVWYSEGVVP